MNDARLFVGIALNDAARAAGVRACRALERAAFAANYESPEKLHVTLAFLGNVAFERIAPVVRALDEVAEQTQAFSIALDKLGAFPNERRPRIVFLGSRASNAKFLTLANNVRARCRDLGFDFHDDAVLHVTIARVKGGSHRALPQLEIPPAELFVREIALFESLPGETTTRHEILHTAPLR